MKLTPVLLVDRIEPSLPFWTERLGFAKNVEVPDGERLGFVILVKGVVEVMLQTFSSLSGDMPALVPPTGTNQVFVFVEVDNFEETKASVGGCEIVLPERTTFYGMREIGVKEPGGHIVILAAPAK